MLLELIRGGCSDGKTCPALHRTDRGTVIVQGWAVAAVGLPGQLDLPAGDLAVEVPAGLLAEVTDTWPGLHRTDRGTLIVPGAAVADPAELRQLRLPAGEQAIEVSAALLAEVLQAC